MYRKLCGPAHSTSEEVVVVQRGIARRTCRSTESAAKKWARLCGQRQLAPCCGDFSSISDNRPVEFAISLVLARLLAPEEFGLIGMLVIFMPLAQALFDSGLDVATISK
ncbi:MAG: oligosaccharide flippase family protein [Anaerolineaceae bacterium]|nr:oligosaccharide flippase family protein [Anaerolineaceae bacterium]